MDIISCAAVRQLRLAFKTPRPLHDTFSQPIVGSGLSDQITLAVRSSWILEAQIWFLVNHRATSKALSFAVRELFTEQPDRSSRALRSLFVTLEG